MKQEDINIGIEGVKTGIIDLLYDNVNEVLSSSIRGVLSAPQGKKLVCSDLSNIEGRVLAWLAGETWKIQAYKDYDSGKGEDLYKIAYAKAFNCPVDQVTSAQRQLGKLLELAMGYSGGVAAFLSMAVFNVKTM